MLRIPFQELVLKAVEDCMAATGMTFEEVLKAVLKRRKSKKRLWTIIGSEAIIFFQGGISMFVIAAVLFVIWLGMMTVEKFDDIAQVILHRIMIWMDTASVIPEKG